MKEVLDGKITITRGRHSEDEVSITIRDVDSRRDFLNIKMRLADFSRALLNEARIPCSLETRDMDKVGKIKKEIPLIFECGLTLYINSNIQALNKLAEEAAKEGYKPSTYYGSKNSFFQVGKKHYARTTQCKYVNRGEEE